MYGSVISADGSPAAKILFGAYGTGNRPVLDGNIGQSGGIPGGSHYGFNLAGARHIVIDGLDFVDHGLAVNMDGSDFVTVRRSRIRDVNSACVKIHSGSDDALIEYNEISNCGRTSNGERIYVSTDPANANSTEDVVWRPVIRYNTLDTGDDIGHEGVEFKPGTRRSPTAWGRASARLRRSPSSLKRLRTL